MKKRYLYALLFGIPGLAVSLIVAFLVFGALAGVMWIYVYGDNPWPPVSHGILPAVFLLTILLLWVTAIMAGFLTGKRLEQVPGFNRRHILVSAGATALPVALIFLQQLGVGNIGPESESRLCSEFCSSKGYSASGMPPKDTGDRTCSCFDNAGQAVITK